MSVSRRWAHTGWYWYDFVLDEARAQSDTKSGIVWAHIRVPAVARLSYNYVNDTRSSATEVAMPKLVRHPAVQRPLIRELGIKFEAVPQRCQVPWRKGQYPENKRFSQKELRYLACPSYKHLLFGNTQRLSARALILQIADYLEYTIYKIKDLLLVAQYLPAAVELRADEERAALEQVSRFLNPLPVPLIFVQRGWNSITCNELRRQFTGLTRERARRRREIRSYDSLLAR